jgi:oxygen-independent coproporphyrinogen-3 oxidase
MEGLSLYIHVPFCRAKCYYCDFNSYDLDKAGEQVDDYVEALIQEILQSGPGRAETVYIGGGTPTVLPLSSLADIMEAARSSFAIPSDAEVSVEANPGTVGTETLSNLLAIGVNRLSLGVQSFDDAELRLLGRIHSAAEAIDAFRAARAAGFANVNLDLIYGLPGQSLAGWRDSLERAADLQPEHLSLYALSVEEGTLLAETIARGELQAPDPDLAADMYELSIERLDSAGYIHYEISNWAKTPAFQCRHNLAYWRNQAYLGLGAGAHSWAEGRRWANASSPAEYIAQVSSGQSPAEWEEDIGSDMEMGETMMMGLRLLEEGVAYDQFQDRFGVAIAKHFADELVDLADLGLIVNDGDRMTLSDRGRLLGNQVFMRFLPDSS